MNPLIFLGIGYMILIGGHHSLKGPVQSLAPPKPDDPTPAYTYNDGIDYVPSDRQVVLGHYFMSIAGLSPVLSAIAGMHWGWLPVLIWMLVGVHWLGAFTEYMHLIISVRNKAKNIGSVVVDKIGKATGTYLNIILIFFCVLTYAIFAHTISTTLEDTPTAVIPTLVLIPLAILFGYMRFKMGAPLTLSSLVFVVIWGFFIYLGQIVPILLPWTTWLVVFAAYTFFACSLPVWVLLQPRDYLNTAILVVGIAVGTLALFVGLPSFEMPAFAGWETPQGVLYPSIFLTVTCGAVAATHALISMGTTSKQVSNEKDSYWITSLGTKGETVIALVAIALVASFYTYDGFIADVATAPGPAFSSAYAEAVTFIGLPAGVGAAFGALILSAFVMTTMDSYARAGRYLLEEVSRDFPTLKQFKLDNHWVTGFLIAVAGYFVAMFTPFMAMWAGFVAMNLFVIVYSYMMITVYLGEQGNPIDARLIFWVVIPGVFMTVTTIYALVYHTYLYYVGAEWAGLVIILACLILLVLALFQFIPKLMDYNNLQQKYAEKHN